MGDDMKSWLLCGLAALAILPAAAQGQRRDKVYIVEQVSYVNRFSIEPYLGALKDAYDIGAGGDTGYLLGFRLAYTLGGVGECSARFPTATPLTFPVQPT
jgi:hypothetical protein